MTTTGTATPLRAVVTSEWTKIRTLRSTGWTLPLTVVIGAGLAALVSLSFRAAGDNLPGGGFDPVFATFYGLTLAQLPLVVFGVLLVGSEFATGTIRPALLATPVRGRLFAGKVLVGAAVAATVALVTVVAAVAAASPVLGADRLPLTQPADLRPVVGGWLYLTLICLFAVGVAALLRSTVVSLAILLPLLFLGAQGLGNIPGVRRVAQFLPDTAGTMILHLAGPPDDPMFDRAYGPWGGIGILALWTVAALAGGYLVLRRRDA